MVNNGLLVPVTLRWVRVVFPHSPPPKRELSPQRAANATSRETTAQRTTKQETATGCPRAHNRATPLGMHRKIHPGMNPGMTYGMPPIIIGIRKETRDRRHSLEVSQLTDTK